jgi:hypothetical protein
MLHENNERKGWWWEREKGRTLDTQPNKKKISSRNQLAEAGIFYTDKQLGERERAREVSELKTNY